MLKAAQLKKLQAIADKLVPDGTVTPIVVRNRTNVGLQRLLKKLYACKPAVRWVGTKDLKTAYQKIMNSHWMLYLLNSVIRKDESAWGGSEELEVIQNRVDELMDVASPEVRDMYIGDWTAANLALKAIRSMLYRKFYVVK